MAEEPPARPGVFLHVEFGVSWTPKKAPRGHHLTYMSKALRKPRQRQPERVIAPDTHYLDMPSAHVHQHVTQRGQFPQYYYYSGAPHRFDPAAASSYFPPQQQQHQYTHQPALRQGLYGSLRDSHQSHNHAQPHRIQQQRHSTFQPSQNTPTAPLFEESEMRRRQSRSLSRGRHERGSSAPAPLSENSWDADPEPIGSSALPRRTRYSSTADTEKALPATPNESRLGEHSMPWSPYPGAGGFVECGNAMDRLDKPQPRQSPRFPDRDRGRITEMQSLATALMTVDNGFEDQWWYQGSRICDVDGDLISRTGHHASVEDAAESPVLPDPGASSAPVSPPSATNFDYWAQYRVDEDQSPSGIPQTSHSSLVDIVSPVSGSGSTCSFTASTRGRLRRSVTTRSEELHLYS